MARSTHLPALALAAFAAAAFTAPAVHADLMIVAKTSGEGMGQKLGGESVTYIKGHKMRTELRNGKDTLVTLMDIDQRTTILINGSKGEAFDVGPLMSQQTGIDEASVNVALESQGTQGRVAGIPCDNYNLRLRLKAAPADPALGDVDVTVEGPACLVKDAPGLAEYAAFYQYAAEQGYFFGDPRAAKAQPGRERGMTVMYKQFAQHGIPYSTNLKIGFAGEGFMAKMLAKTGFTTTTEVTEISTGVLEDSLFEVPAGVKVKKN